MAGYTTWRKLGRQVRKGEQAIRILAPCPVRRRRAPAKPSNNEDGTDHGTDAEEFEAVHFKGACVFDISQTEGEELPEPELPDVNGAANGLLQDLGRVATERGVRVEFRELGPDTFGRSRGGLVELNGRYPTAQQAKTLAHELAHEAMHHGPGRPSNRHVVELEAEAVAYVVCRHFGLDVELRASRYIALWGGDAKALAGSLSRISGIARDLIVETERLVERPVGGLAPATTTGLVPAA